MTRLKRNTPGGSRSGNRVDPNQEIDWLPFRKLGGSHCGNWVAPVGGNFALLRPFSESDLSDRYEAGHSRILFAMPR